jgi:hypothetical protein
MYVFFMVEPDLNDVPHLTWSLKLMSRDNFLWARVVEIEPYVSQISVHFFSQHYARDWQALNQNHGRFPFEGAYQYWEGLDIDSYMRQQSNNSLWKNRIVTTARL